MSSRGKIAIQIATFILISAFSVPQIITAAVSDVSELKEKEKELEQRVQTLREDVKEEQETLETINARLAELRSNIAQIQSELRETEDNIRQLNSIIAERSAALESVKEGLAESVRELEAAERMSTLAMLFTYNSFAEAIMEIDQREILTGKIGQRYQSIVEYTGELTEARDQLELAKLSLASSRVSLDLQQQAVAVEQDKQKQILASSRSILQAAEVEHLEIKKQLFAAAFDNSGKTITFEQAIYFAEISAQRLRDYNGQEISVPLLLAVVRHESNFGSYLGKGHYKSAMCSDAQAAAFVRITQSLDLDPDLTPVSKPAKNQSCGGAMGYAQFLPLTWLGYAQRVAELTGNSPASPWNAEDAFMAVALKLSANGATRGDTAAEKRRHQWEAVMTYFSGSKWKNPAVLRNIRWYGDNILRTADSYASLI